MPQRGLRWYEIINLWDQLNSRLVSKVTGVIDVGRADASRARFTEESTVPAAELSSPRRTSGAGIRKLALDSK